ncbi:hypothetical protein [Nocardioides sp. 1609]|uniref:hypothetical protein n=1 Tax=Nocardioides sp. 1609 TaxID=2508327 RepID=UPI00106FAF8F|nr:hypothetical protein [Nocardioides sp. 1609]
MPIYPRVPARLAAVAAAALLAGLLPTTPAQAAAAPDPSGPPAAPTTGPGPTGVSPTGTWRVVAIGGDTYEVSWTSPDAFPTTSDRPTIGGAGLAFGAPTIEDDGRTVTAVVTSAERPDPVELDVVLSGDRVDERGLDPADTVGETASPAPGRAPLAATDPGEPGTFSTATSDYTLEPVKVAGMRQPIEMVGHVVEPAADQLTGPRPLVLFMHGRHDFCYDPGDPDNYSERWPCRAPFAEIPSHLGYDYVQRVLASQGYATVSVRVNGINAQDDRLDDGGAAARATIVEAHLDHWVDVAAGHQVDLGQVVLVGHSRGGEGVDRASIGIPLSAPYTIAGQVLVAPTNFASHTAPYVPTVTVLPYCDGDVSDIQGQRFTDTGRDLATDDTSLKSSVLVMGANHNFFNTEWTPGIAAAPASDDWYGDRDGPCGRRDPGRLKAGEQRDVGTAYIAGAVKLFAGDDAYLPLFDGSPVTVPSIGDADVRSHAIGGGRDERRPGGEATATTPRSGARTQVCKGSSTSATSASALCGRGTGNLITPHWTPAGEATPSRKFFEMSWTNRGATGGLTFADPLDLSTDRLELRTIVDSRFTNVGLRVRLTDGNGDSAVVEPVGGTRLDALLEAPSLTKLWAQALLVDATGLAGVDLADIRSVELVSASTRGRVWVADLAAAPSTLAPVPARRLPQLDLGRLVVAEGSSKARKVARVPFTITGTTTSPARVVVATVGQHGSARRTVVDIAPGQTAGTIPVTYVGNRVDDHDLITQVRAWPTRGIATDDYLGGLTVLDDDPDAIVTFKPVKRTVREGQPIIFRVTTSAATGYDIYVGGTVVNGPGTDLRGTDIRAAWMRRHVGTDIDLTAPLHTLYVQPDGRLEAGTRTFDLRLPTRADRVREGVEKLTIRLYMDDERRTRTISVLDTR